MPPIVARPYVRMFLRVDVVDEVEAVISLPRLLDETVEIRKSVGFDPGFNSQSVDFWIDEV